MGFLCLWQRQGELGEQREREGSERQLGPPFLKLSVGKTRLSFYCLRVNRLMGFSWLLFHFGLSCTASREKEATLHYLVHKSVVGPLTWWSPHKFKPLKKSGRKKNTKEENVGKQKDAGGRKVKLCWGEEKDWRVARGRGFVFRKGAG